MSDESCKYVVREISPSERAQRNVVLRFAGGHWGEILMSRVGTDIEDRVSVHRLLAVAEYGFDAVSENHVYHANGLRWDNQPDNILLGERNTDDELLEWIDSYVRQFGVVPAQHDIRGWPGPAPRTYFDRFGSWGAAIRAAGYTPRSEAGGREV